MPGQSDDWLAGVPVSERLERVERFEELREGMIVVVKNCSQGHRRCRSMLVSRDTCSECGMDCFTGVPTCRDNADGVCVEMVNDGDVFRVLDGLEEPSTETAAATGTTRRTPQKERAR